MLNGVIGNTGSQLCGEVLRDLNGESCSSAATNGALEYSLLRKGDTTVIHWQRQKSAHLTNSERSCGSTCSFHDDLRWLFFHACHDSRFLLASPPWRSGLFLGWHAPRILFPSPPMLAFSQARGATSAFKSEAVPRCGAAFSSDEGPRLSRSAHTFFRAVRIFLSGLVDSAAFQEVSLGREVSIIFTSGGFLIYRQEAISGGQRETVGR
jgi:hypothetical protein